MAAPVIIFLGPPGAGKGTQSELLAKKLVAVHLSSGQIIRDSQDQGVIDWMSKGNLIESKDFFRIVGQAIKSIPGNRAIVFDSVGKKLPETEWLNHMLSELDRKIQKVIYLNVEHAEAVSRNMRRNRADDGAKEQQLRWELYQRETLPVLNFYRDQGLLVEVSGMGTVEEVAARIDRALL